MDFAHLVRALLARRFAVLHFAAIGAVVFFLQLWFFGASPRPEPSAALEQLYAAGAPQAEIDDELLYREALRRGLDQGDGVIRQRLIRDMRFLEPDNPSDDETLYQRARELGLDREDVVVRRRLVEKLRRRLIAEAPILRPTSAELENYLAQQGDRFTVPARVQLDQIHFDDAQRATQARQALAAGEIEAGAIRGDPLPLPRQMPSLSERELAGRLGSGFAARVFTLPTGRWSGPVASSYGHSLVFVHGQTPAREPALSEVRARVEGEWRAEREAVALEQALAKLRARAVGESAPIRPTRAGPAAD